MAALADRWGIAPDTRLVLVPGPLAPESGHRPLLEAAAGLDRRDFTLLLLGHAEPDGAYARELTALLRTRRLGDRVRFGGEVDDLPAALALADVVALPVSRPEPSGLPAAAAQAMGKPVIVTDQGALAESVMPSATGWLVPPDDAGELGRALDLALSLDEEVRQRLAARARAYVLGTFGMPAMCERMLELYRELLRLAPHRHPAVAGPVAEVS
jgi:glycosyltransferase involved in cell wall biosynthesis